MNKQKLIDHIRGHIVGLNLEVWEDVQKDMESGDWDGAEWRFGHCDDCFDRGLEIGESLSLNDLLTLILEGEFDE